MSLLILNNGTDSNVIIFLIVAFLIDIVIAALAGFIASAKGYSWGIWFLFGLILSPIVLIIALLIAGDKKPSTDEKKTESELPKWKCSKCGRLNASESRFCPNCGQERRSEDLVYNGWQCKCGNKNTNDASYCTRCGLSMDEGKIEIDTSVYYICWKCGNIFEKKICILSKMSIKEKT